jgi:ABC-type cobalamin/Fe3+-siderophores transport system ATPase subunit
MLTIKSLTVAYGKRTILENIDVSFQRVFITVIKG